MNLDYTENTYPVMLASLAGISIILAEKFPDTLILPAFGNNDTKYHDNPIPTENQEFFYDYTFGLWFDLLPGNKALLT